MTLFHAIVLGVVQGLTEFFPVSSSGHLAIVQALFGLHEPMVAFDVFLHLGTLVAVMIYFAPDIIRLVTVDRRTLGLLIVASIPTFLIGFFCKDAIEAVFGAPAVVGIMMAFTGIALIAASVFGRYADRKKTWKKPGVLSSLAIGVAQGIAILPGVSRSGATIMGGIFSGFTKEEAFKFAFLLSIPAVGGAAVLKAAKIGSALINGQAVVYLAGGVTAMAVALATIGILRRIVVGNKLYIFGVYCIVAGIAVALIVR